MAELFLFLAIFIWMALGALITMVAWMLVDRRKARDAVQYAPHAELLGKSCWIEDKYTGKHEKFRIVAVSHKGAINVRRWDDDSGHGAFWIPSNKVAERVSFQAVSV